MLSQEMTPDGCRAYLNLLRFEPQLRAQIRTHEVRMGGDKARNIAILPYLLDSTRFPTVRSVSFGYLEDDDHMLEIVELLNRDCCIIDTLSADRVPVSPPSWCTSLTSMATSAPDLIRPRSRRVRCLRWMPPCLTAPTLLWLWAPAAAAARVPCITAAAS